MSPTQKPRLLIVGGGIAGTVLALKASQYCDVVLVDPKGYVELTWATPRGMVDEKVAARVAIDFRDLPGMGRVVQAKVTKLTSKEATLSTGEVLGFEYAAICSGSSTNEHFKSTTATNRQQRLEELKNLTGEIKAAKSIVVVGGGPAGVEMAAEIVDSYAGKSVTLVHPGKLLLSTLPAKSGKQAQKWLEAHGVKVVLGAKVDARGEGRGPANLSLTDRTSIAADLVLWCTGSRQVAGFLAGGDLAACLDARGGVKVLPTLQLEGHPNVFALGDCTNVPEAKQAFFAAKHGELVAASLQTLIRTPLGGNPKLGAWKPNMGGPDAMLVTLGRSDGVFRVGSASCTGCLPAQFKSKGLFVDKFRKQFGLKD